MCPFSHVCADGKWHTDENGVPFSSDTFVSICLNVWKEPECRLTAEQLVWTCMIVSSCWTLCSTWKKLLVLWLSGSTRS
jgi:hypothetical protein